MDPTDWVTETKQNYPSSILLKSSCQPAERVFRRKEVGSFDFIFNS